MHPPPLCIRPAQTYSAYRRAEEQRQSVGELQTEHAALAKRVQALSEENMRLLNSVEELAYFRQEVFSLEAEKRQRASDALAAQHSLQTTLLGLRQDLAVKTAELALRDADIVRLRDERDLLSGAACLTCAVPLVGKSRLSNGKSTE